MLARDLISLFVVPLNRAGIEYMVTGSVAAMLYGEPRMTHDIDLVVELPARKIPALFDSFPEREYYRTPEEVIGVEIARTQRGHLNLIHHATGYKADIYLQSSDALHAWGMKNRRTLIIGEVEVRIAPAEYVIIRKLEYYRESGFQKHLLDIEGMFRLKGEEISFSLIEEWIRKLSLEKVWAQVKSNVQEMVKTVSQLLDKHFYTKKYDEELTKSISVEQVQREVRAAIDGRKQ